MIEALIAVSGAGTQVAVAAPGRGDPHWAGGPSAARAGNWTWLAYRLRRPVDRGRGYANVVGRSRDGVRFETIATLTSVVAWFIPAAARILVIDAAPCVPAGPTRSSRLAVAEC
jgi:hypothetical protein